MTQRRKFAYSAVLVALVASIAGAQRKTFVASTGTVYHYHGDTIWSERDTTETRVIYRGDTIIRRAMIDGREQYEMTFVLIGDSARVVSSRSASGQVSPPPSNGRALPRLIATSELDMLSRNLEMQRIRNRVPPLRDDPNQVPLSPPSAITYIVSPATTIIHVLDTVRYVRGCPTVHADTTVFVLFGKDSTRRLTSPARTFGQAMAVSLISQMRMSIIRKRLDQSGAGMPRELPRIPEGCLGQKP
jgi:hypothetical protein